MIKGIVLALLVILNILACSHSNNTKPQRGINNVETKRVCDELVDLQMPEVGDNLIFKQDVTIRTAAVSKVKGPASFEKYFENRKYANHSVVLVTSLTHPEMRKIKKGDVLTIKKFDNGIIMTSDSGKEYKLGCYGSACNLMHLDVLFEKPKKCNTYNVTPVNDVQNSNPETPVEI